MRKISFLMQEILRLFVLFLFFFVWIRYFVRDFYRAAAISIVCVFSVELLLHMLKKKTLLKKHLRTEEKRKAEDMFFSLSCDNSPLQFLCTLAKKKHKFVVQKRGFISIDYPIEHQKTLMFFCSNFDGLKTKDLIEIYKKAKSENPTKVVVLCKEIADKQIYLMQSSLSLNFEILDQYETYKNLYKPYDCFPKITIQKSAEKKLAIKDLVAYSFNKKRTKGYLLSAFVLIFSSLFVRQTLYYCIVSSLLILLAVISQFNVQFNKKKDADII